MTEPRPALIIFDIDGTLLQTELVTVPAVQRTFAEFGLPIPAGETICGFFGKPVADYEAWLAAQCAPGQAEAIVEATNRLELALIGEEGRLYPGAREALDHLRGQGHFLALCSNGPEAYVQEFVDSHGLRPYLAAIRARGNRSAGKREMIRELLEEIAARPVVVAGDRADDIEAAHANGALAVAAAYGYGDETEHAEADAIAVSSLDLLPCIFALLR